MHRILLMTLFFTGLMACGGGEDFVIDGQTDFWPDAPDYDVLDNSAGEIEGNIDEMPRLALEGEDTLPEYGDCLTRTTEQRCNDHSECNDNIFCNGEERCGRFCEGNFCYTTIPLPCSEPPAGNHECHPGVCVEEQQACLYPIKDSDRDGYGDDACEGGDDCNDHAPGVHPGITDICDGVDNNCNVAIDEDGWKVPEDIEAGGSISSPETQASHHTITSYGGGWQAAWLENSSTIKFALIDGSGPVGPVDVHGPVPGDRAVGRISILGSGGDFYVVWSEESVGGSEILLKHYEDGSAASADILFSTTDPTQGIHDLTVKNMHESSSRAGIFFTMGVGGDGGNYEVFYLPVLDFTSSPPSFPLDAEPRRLTHFIGFSGHPDAAAIPDRWMVVWDDERDGDREIYLTKINFDGDPQLGAPVKITDYPGDRQEPKIACLPGEDECAIVWTDERYGNFSIFATVTDIGGGVTAPEHAITEAPANAWHPAIAPDAGRGQFFVAYSSSEQPNKNSIYFNVTGSNEGAIFYADPHNIDEESSSSIMPLLSLSDEGLLAIMWQEVVPGSGTSINLKILGCN